VSAIDIKDIGSWPAAVVKAKREEAMTALRTTIKVDGPAIVQTTIDATVPHPPVDRATYRRNWKCRNIKDGVRLYNSTVQASIIEDGRRPGFGVSWEGLASLRLWVHRHGMDKSEATSQRSGLKGRGRLKMKDRTEAARDSIAFLIARAIKARGLPAKHVLARAKPLLAQLMQRTLAGVFGAAT
jgi:hypothetical protein